MPREMFLKDSRLGRRLLGVLTVAAILAVAGVLGSLFLAGGSSADSIRVVQVGYDRADAPAGNVWYLLDLNATDRGANPWAFDPSFLTLGSNASTTFVASGAYDLTGLMAKQTIGPGGSKVGEVAFLLPSKEAPLHLTYADAESGMRLSAPQLPPVSTYASRFPLNVKLSINGNSVNGWTVSSYNGTQGWIRSIIANGVIQNNSLVFFSGQTVQVNLWFEYLKKPTDPATIRFETASASGGFGVLNAQQVSQFTMTGWGAQSGLVLLLKVPQGELSGPVSVAVEFSA